MHPTLSAGRRPVTPPRTPAGRRGAGLALAALCVLTAGGADGGGTPSFDYDALAAPAARLGRVAGAWFHSTPPADRVTWGGLVASAGLALGVLLERSVRLRRRRVVPPEFGPRFLERLASGKLDRGKALDYCELHPSPASRVALAAVRRWGRPSADLERATTLAQRVEVERLGRNVGTLRRVAALAPLVGLLGTLAAASRALLALGGDGPVTAAAWGPAVGAALTPLTAGVALAVLALVAYDGLAGRAEALAGDLERVAAETIDAISLSLPPETRPAPAPNPPAVQVPVNRTPHQVRIDLPNPPPRVAAPAPPPRVINPTTTTSTADLEDDFD